MVANAHARAVGRPPEMIYPVGHLVPKRREGVRKHGQKPARNDPPGESFRDRVPNWGTKRTGGARRHGRAQMLMFGSACFLHLLSEGDVREQVPAKPA